VKIGRIIDDRTQQIRARQVRRQELCPAQIRTGQIRPEQNKPYRLAENTETGRASTARTLIQTIDNTK